MAVIRLCLGQVSLSTAPDPTGATHWGQQTFCLHPPIDCAPGDAVEGSIRITRKKENHRLMQARRYCSTAPAGAHASLCTVRCCITRCATENVYQLPWTESESSLLSAGHY